MSSESPPAAPFVRSIFHPTDFSEGSATAFAHALAIALFHPRKMTEVQLGQLWAYLHNVMLTAQNSWLAHRSGMTSDTSWNHAKKQAAAFVGFRVGRIWWEYDKFEYEEAFVAEIDAELERSDPADFERVVGEMLTRIRNLEE